MSTIDLSQLSAEQLSDLENKLNQKKEQERKKRDQERKAYEADRDDFVLKIISKAKALSEQIKAFKIEVEKGMEHHAEKLNQYGEMRSNSKGGFTINNSNGQKQVKRLRDTEPSWDERADKAVELIKEVLGETVKKRDRDTYEILMSFIERNNKGDLEMSKVMNLLQHEDRYTDPRWKEGLRLLREAYSNQLKGYGYAFKEKGEQGKWESISLSFSSL